MSDHMIKESEVIYARGFEDPKTGKPTRIDPAKRATLRKRIQDLMKSHDCHGEAMLKMVSEDDAHDEVHPITAILQDEEVCFITTHGVHHPAVIHEMLDVVATMHLDVLHADITQPGKGSKEDRSVLYVKNVDDDELPEMEAATERERRHEIRKKLTEVFDSHKIDGHVSVRPLEGGRPGVITDSLTADDALKTFGDRTSFRRVLPSGKVLLVDNSVSTLATSAERATDNRHTLGLGMQINRSLRVTKVGDGGQAITGGITVGDVITKMGDVDFTSGKTDVEAVAALTAAKTAGVDIVVEFNGGIPADSKLVESKDLEKALDKC